MHKGTIWGGVGQYCSSGGQWLTSIRAFACADPPPSAAFTGHCLPHAAPRRCPLNAGPTCGPQHALDWKSQVLAILPALTYSLFLSLPILLCLTTGSFIPCLISPSHDHLKAETMSSPLSQCWCTVDVGINNYSCSCTQLLIRQLRLTFSICFPHVLLQHFERWSSAENAD